MIDQDNIKELDSHWNEVMDLAVKYGFITYAYGGYSCNACKSVERIWRRRISSVPKSKV